MKRILVLVGALTLGGWLGETLHAQPVRIVTNEIIVPPPQFVVPAVVSGTSLASPGIVMPATAVVAIPRRGNATDLVPLLKQAKTQLSAERLPNVATARSELESALQGLEQFIAPGTPNGDRWSRFLQLDQLREELARERPLVTPLSELEMNMRQNYLGLEYPQFVRLRERMADYIRALRYGVAPDATLEFLNSKLDELTAELDKSSETGTDALSELAISGRVGLVANYLAESRQAPQLVSQLRGRYGYPNVRVSVQESFVNRLLARSVAEPAPVRECILGTNIFGTACLAGNVSADLKPMQNGVALRLNMNALLTSQNQGYNRGVVINTTGRSPVYASKEVYITPTGITSGPASAVTDLQTQIHSIQHKRRIVRRIATRRAAEQKPEADAIAEGRMQRRIQSQYETQVNTQLADANAQFNQFANASPPELRRVGWEKPTLNFHSTESGVLASVVQAAGAQLAAAGPSPLPQGSTSQVIVEVHQSAVINTLDVILGGRRIRSEQLDDFSRQIAGKVSDELRAEAQGESWSILLANFHPLELEFDDQAIKLVLRIAQMTRGDQVLTEPITITVNYIPSFSDGIVTLTRQGPVDLQFRDTRGMRVVTLRSFLKGKFEAAFKEQVVLQRIDLATRFPRLPGLRIDQWRLDNGWLQVGLR